MQICLIANDACPPDAFFPTSLMIVEKPSRQMCSSTVRYQVRETLLKKIVTKCADINRLDFQGGPFYDRYKWSYGALKNGFIHDTWVTGVTTLLKGLNLHL